MIALRESIASSMSALCDVRNSYLSLTDLYSSIAPILTSPSSFILAFTSLFSFTALDMTKSSVRNSIACRYDISKVSQSLSLRLSSCVSYLAFLISAFTFWFCRFSSCSSILAFSAEAPSVRSVSEAFSAAACAMISSASCFSLFLASISPPFSEEAVMVLYSASRFSSCSFFASMLPEISSMSSEMR